MGTVAGAAIFMNGLVAYIDAANVKSYSGSGVTANSLTSNLLATLTNDVGFGTTNLGSFNFDGTNDFINVPIDAGLFTTEGTMIIWLKNDEATPASSLNTGFMGFGPIGDAGTNDHYPWVDGFAYLGTFRNNRIGPITLSASVIRSNIHMVCITSNSSEWKLYQNAVLQYTTSSSGSVTMNNTRIGYSVSQLYNYKGKVYCFILYNRALVQQEILQHYRAFRGRFGIQ
jgi:hypothetical protein